jgi:hypothetical protein
LKPALLERARTVVCRRAEPLRQCGRAHTGPSAVWANTSTESPCSLGRSLAARCTASALGADTKNWWFLNAGDAKSTHAYLEQTLKFFGIRERSDPADIEANGRYAHDLGFILVDRDFNVIGKWPLADARSDEARQRDPQLYDRVKEDLFNRIRAELNKKPSNP